MADNTTLNPGTGGDVIATDDIGGVKYQVVKSAFGATDAVTLVQNAHGSGVPIEPVTGALLSGVLTNVNDDFLIDCLGASQVFVQIASQNYVGATITVAGAIDTSNFVALTFQSSAAGATGTNLAISNAPVFIPCAGMQTIRLRLTAVTSGTGTINARVIYGAPNPGFISTIGRITAGTLNTDLGKAEDATHTSGDTGVLALAVRNDATTVLTSTDGDYSGIGVDGFGAVYTRQRFTANQGNNFTKHRAISAASTNATSVKASIGNVYSIYLANSHATLVRYFKLYDKASAPTVNTDTPTFTFLLPPLSNVDVPINGFLSFALGIAYSITDLMADTGQAAIGANEVTVSIGYS